MVRGSTLIPAIFGLSTHIRTVAGRLTDAGYVVGVPDLFWRFAPGWQADADEAGLAASMATAARLDRDGAVDDCGAVLEHLAALPDVGGDPGVIGFCLGGTLAFGTAIRYQPSVCVSYYGSGVVGLLDGIGDVNCPTLLHFGSRDQSIPGEAVEQIAAATDGREHRRQRRDRRPRLRRRGTDVPRRGGRPLGVVEDDGRAGRAPPVS